MPFGQGSVLPKLPIYAKLGLNGPVIWWISASSSGECRFGNKRCSRKSSFGLVKREQIWMVGPRSDQLPPVSIVALSVNNSELGPWRGGHVAATSSGLVH